MNDIALACAKLSETSSIPREIFRDEKTKRDFLKQQEEYRKHTEQIRKRCIELEPNNAGYRSNLAYTYYQNINELTARWGRKDGNLKKEIDNFINAIDETLALDPRRVTDLYRKGRILADVLPDKIRWTKSYEDYGDFTEKLRSANDVREQGIQTLLSAKQVWENLNYHNKNERYWKNRYRKDYIKSLYVLSHAYYDKIKQDWEESVFALNLRDDVPTNQQVAVNQDDKESITHAIQILKKCCETDCPPQLLQEVQQTQQKLEQLAAYNGIEEGVDKLYSIGKFFFAKYWILSGYGLKETAAAIEARETANRYLQAALKCEWSSQKSRQDKKYIAERLARVFISKEEYEQALLIIAENTEELEIEFAEPYILQICALALLKCRRLKCRRFETTQYLLNTAAKSGADRKPWLTRFLMGCAYLEGNRIKDAQKQFDLAHKEASRVGKKNIDSLLIAKAFVAYRSADAPEALKFLEEAKRLNPNRVSIGERIRKWQQSEDIRPCNTIGNIQ